MSLENLTKYTYLSIPVVIVYNYFFNALLDYIIKCDYDCPMMVYGSPITKCEYGSDCPPTDNYDPKCENEKNKCLESKYRTKFYALMIISVISLILGIILNSQDQPGLQYTGTSIIFSAIVMMIFTVILNWTIIDSLFQLILLGISLCVILGITYAYYNTAS